MRVERYFEVFGGGGWVLFHKEPSPFEVFNDFNADLVNLYRCIRDKPEKLIQRLEYTLNAREDFEHIRKLLKSKAELTCLFPITYMNTRTDVKTSELGMQMYFR